MAPVHSLLVFLSLSFFTPSLASLAATTASPPPPRSASPPPPPSYGCECKEHNKGKYFPTTPDASLPTTCTLPDKWCKCDAQYYQVAPWLLKYKVASRYKAPAEAKALIQAGLTYTDPVMYGQVDRASCCAACHDANFATPKAIQCAYWLHFVPPASSTSTSTSTCSNGTPDTCGYCLLFQPGTSPSCTSTKPCLTTGAPNYNLPGNYSTVGKGCVGGKNDPHFTGAQGTHFDFNGLPEQSFCLITDPGFQVNMKMTGYYDRRTVGATIVNKEGLAVRTWIKELGILWKGGASGVRHALQLTARSGKSEARGEGYMGSMALDGSALPRMEVGQVLSLGGGLSITFSGFEKQGGGRFDVDVYQVNIANVLSAEVKLRAAHPLLQKKDDAMVHINVQFFYVNNSPATHGVLGQTFQAGRGKRAIAFSAMAALMGKDLAADSEVFKGFLDGEVADYHTSSVLSTDCRASSFGGQVSQFAM